MKKILPIVIIVVILFWSVVSAIYMNGDKTSEYAVNDSITYSFDANGGKVTDETKTYKHGTKVKKLPKANRSGYTFMGWYTKKQDGKIIANETEITDKATKDTLYARWAPKQFMQNDNKWKNTAFGNDTTIGEMGCGPTALSMVLYTLGYKQITPVSACRWAANNGYKTTAPGRVKDNFFIKYAEKHDIKVKRLNSGNLKKKSESYGERINAKALKAVQQGNWVIALMTDGTWARRGHFILWYDISGKNALIRDPTSKDSKRVKNKYKLLQSEAIRYFVIEIPDHKKISPPA